MFKNVYEVFKYLGEQTDLFKPIGEKICEIDKENEDIKKTLDILLIENLNK